MWDYVLPDGLNDVYKERCGFLYYDYHGSRVKGYMLLNLVTGYWHGNNTTGTAIS